jgi:hypothetical protein
MLIGDHLGGHRSFAQETRHGGDVGQGYAQ